MPPPASPGEIELYASFRKHLGPRFEAAGLRVQFHYNQAPGIHFRVPIAAEYRDSILRGIQDGMAARFPLFPSSGSIWITEVTVYDVDSSQRAFYRVARSIIEQAYALAIPTM
ncbi:MAG TPA: hypothetical protein VFW45_11770 [Candidatus Polarisedimenticolia bacterium]|nr:hypothetical protein [Candidatus Polarisedimenticolia bacterium]